MTATLVEYGTRVWKGDERTVAEARQRYSEDSHKNLLSYAGALYSFRRDPKNAQALLRLTARLLRHQEELVASMADDFYGSWFIDRADMLTTYYEWISRQDVLAEIIQQMVHQEALRLCVDALPAASVYKESGARAHSYFLLLLTHASLQFDTYGIGWNLDTVRQQAPIFVKDPNQRARIFIKLGMLLRKAHVLNRRSDWFAGLYWGIRGCLVRGVPRNVRLKGLAALLGVRS